MAVSPLTMIQSQLRERINQVFPYQGKPLQCINKDNEKNICIAIAEIFAQSGVMKRHLSCHYINNGLYYVPFEINWFKSFIFSTVKMSGMLLTEKMCALIVKEMMIRVPEHNGPMNEETFTLFQNGYVDNQTGAMVGMVPDYFPTMCVEAQYLPYQLLHHPTADRFLESIAGGDPILVQRLWEVIGYCISSDAMAKRIFVLVGESGDNGKSTFLNFLASLISEHGSVQMNLTNLSRGWFSMSELIGKRIEYSADEGDLNLNTTQIAKLKSLSGHDKITVDVKHKSQVRYLSTCKILIASNHNIGFAYTACDPAFSRRICALPFDVKIPKEEQNPFLVHDLFLERDQIVTEAFRYYVALKNRNYVFSGDDIYDAPLNMFPNNQLYSTIVDFSNNCCCFEHGGYTYTSDLYYAFVLRYGSNIFGDITAFSRAFYKANSALVQKHKKHTVEKYAWGFDGVILKQAAFQSNPEQCLFKRCTSIEFI